MCLLMFWISFSDESIIAVLDDRVQTVYRRTDEEFLPQCLKNPVKFLAEIMIRGQYQFIELGDSI